MEIIDSISEKGDGLVNEDSFGLCSDRCWVVDGVTAKSDVRFYSSVSDAQFLSSAFSKALEKFASLRHSLSNRELLMSAMDFLRNGLSKQVFEEEERIHQPSFTIAMLHVLSETIQIDILSDCYVIARGYKGIDIYTDNRIKCIVDATNRVKEQIFRRDIEEECARRLLHEQKVENRKLMNVDEGYWVGTVDGLAFRNTVSRILDKNNVDMVLLCSDGFYRLFEKGITTFDEVFTRTVSLRDSIIRLRAYEKDESDIETKKSDDATAILVKI